MTGCTALGFRRKATGGRAPFVCQTAASFLWSHRSHEVVRSGYPDAESVLGPRYLEPRGGRRSGASPFRRSKRSAADADLRFRRPIARG